MCLCNVFQASNVSRHCYEVQTTNKSVYALCPASYDFLFGRGCFLIVSHLVARASAARGGKERRSSICGVCRGKQQTCIDRNTRHSHPWSDVVGGEGVSGWECTGKLRTGGRVRRVWMVLDGSKEASLPSCGDKPSLALQQRVTHSKAQWRILGRIGFKRIKRSVCLVLEVFPPLTRLLGQ